MEAVPREHEPRISPKQQGRAQAQADLRGSKGSLSHQRRSIMADAFSQRGGICT